MVVARIVPDLLCEKPQDVARFYQRVFGLEVAMDNGFIVTLTGETQQTQLSLMSEGGSGTEVPAISIEVDDLAEVLARTEAEGQPPVYGPVDEPWDVRRFFIRDPAGHLVNVLTHKRDQT